ncbi:MFS transporter [Campylobacter cuniculorum]|uniref:MFS transporter n=1 Tax=Campylobacter cuniculorum TaxID=374106 RepID=UPI0023EFF77E|nr:MFS transporter [Campylobacter cuniculorum]
MSYRALLRRNHNIKILSCVQFITYFGAWFSQAGVFTLLVDLSAPTWAISVSAMLAFLPGIFLAPINGVIVEKNKPKKLLIAMASVELVSIFSLIFVTSLERLWLLFILIFLRLCVASIYFQAQMSLLAKILNSKELKLANEIHSIIWAVSYTSGMSLAGIFIYFLNVQTAFLFDCFLLGIGILFLLNLKINDFKSEVTQQIGAMIKEGFLYVFKNKTIFHLILLHAFLGLTAYEALVTLLAKHSYKELLSASLVIGFLNAVRALALMVSPMILSPFINEKTTGYLYFGQGFGILFWALTQFNFYLSFLGLLAAGFCTSSLWSYTYTMIQKNSDKKYYGRVIAYTDMIFLSFSAMISILVGVLFDWGLGLNLITALLGMAFIFAGLYWTWFYKNHLN